MWWFLHLQDQSSAAVCKVLLWYLSLAAVGRVLHLWCLYPAAVFRVLHLCHVDELEGTSLLQLTNCCQQLVDLKLENCSFGDAANLRIVMLSLI